MYVFGIDVGGTSIKIGIFTEDRKLVDKWSIETNKETLFQDLASSLKEYCLNNNIVQDDILGYGIGIPGVVKKKVALKCVNLGWENVNIASEFKKAMGHKVKVLVYNDANLAAYGEYSLYDHKYDTIVFMTLGTGVGGGIISNGYIQEGANGLFGEVGHLRIENEFQFPCSCGKTGCLETVSSATGILRLANYFAEKENQKSYSSCKEVVDAAKNNDPIASKAFDIACKNIGKALAMLSLVIDPNAFIIGGGVSDAGMFLIDNIKKHFDEECFMTSKNVDVLLSNYRNDAGIFGGAALIIKNKKRGKKWQTSV